MSNSLAIAAVTATLRNIIALSISDELGSGSVTTRPPDKARENGSGTNQVNIFLYQTLPNATLRNQDIANRVKPGETGMNPLALNLYYLITAYGKDYDDILGHRLLGAVMRNLHDRAILNPNDIKAALAESNLHQQIERIRIIQQPLSLEELSKLWATFQTQYRISAAYEVSVVLIDSSRPVKTPLPVLTRGEPINSESASVIGGGDEGILLQANPNYSYPKLTAVLPPNKQPSVRLGELLTLQGEELNSDSQIIVRLRHPLLTKPIELSPQPGATATEIKLQLPYQPNIFPAGLYTATVQLEHKGKIQTTNSLPFTLAPLVDVGNLDINDNQVILSINCTPSVWPQQQVVLLVGSREFKPQQQLETNEKINQLQFDLSSLPRTNNPQDYFIRLRVDGTDSLLIIDYFTKPPAFDSMQKIRLPPG